VASRDTLLDAIARRQLAPFDRSIDVVVGRLRRKIEPDPKRPRIIVTVPGEGYRFDGLALPCAFPLSDGGPPDSASEGLPSAAPAAHEDPHVPSEPFRRWRAALGVGALCLVLVLTFAGSLLRARGGGPVLAEPPKVLVAPFANLTGDASVDRVGHALAFEVAAFLGAYPGLRVLSPSISAPDPTRDAMQAARTAGARYLLHGGVRRFRNALRITATLYDAATETAVWSQVFDLAENEAEGWKEDISRRIYDSIAGLRGKIYANEERVAWGKTSAELSEYDYFLRGLPSYLGLTLPNELKARAVFEEGRDRYPDSALLRVMEAWTYLDGDEPG
jgi:TolB-like protein